MINIDALNDEEKLAALESIHKSIAESKEIQRKKITTNVEMIVKALKKIEADLKQRYDETGQLIANLKSGEDGRDGKDGKDGKNGKDGRDGPMGPRGYDGAPGRNGLDGTDGVSVTDAHIDFDGSLIISLSSGRVINVGEVVAADIAEKIKVITNGGGTSQSVLDAIASLQAQIDAIASGLEYQGTWNASTNTPTLASSVGTAGYYYIVATAGSTNLNGITDWQIGDWAVFNGTVWQKIDQSNLVTSVAGRTGAIVLTTADIGGLGTIATQAANNVSITGGSITGITDLAIADGGTGASTAPNARTNLGATTVGSNVFTLTNPSAITFPRFNADNTVSALDAPTFRTAIGAGSGTVTSVAATVPSFLSIGGSPVTSSGTLAITLSGTALPTTSGGTGLTSFTANGVVYASSTSALATGSALTYDGSKLVNTGYNKSTYQVSTGGIGTFESSGGAYLSYLSGANIYSMSDGSGTEDILNLRASAHLFYINSVEQARLTSTGLGLGTNSPGSKLDVKGTLRLSGSTSGYVGLAPAASAGSTTYTLPSADGTANQALVTNGSGTLSWASTATGTVTSVGGTGTVSGISLSGTVTSSGNLTLGGALDLSAYNGAGAFTTLSASGVATFSAGSASAPAISRTGDTNTGIFFPAADTIAFAEGGTESMRIDSSGNLGLGVTPSAWTTYKAYQIGWGALASYAGADTAVFSNAFFESGAWKYVGNGFASQYRQLNGLHSWQTAPNGTASDAITFTQAMTLDASGNLGIGTTSPAYKLDINTVGGSQATARLYGNDQSNVRLRLENVGSGGRTWEIVGGAPGANNANFSIRDVTGSTTPLTIDSSGNLGLGVTPSAWDSIFKVIDVGTTASFTGSSGGANVFNNAWYNGSTYIYKTTAGAARYLQSVNEHLWFNAPSGTAGNAITFTQAMTLDASGNLLVGTTSPLYSTANRGNITLNGASTAILGLGIAGVATGYLYTDANVVSLGAESTRSMTFAVNGSERARIDSSGNFMVGTTTIGTGNRMNVVGNNVVFSPNTAGKDTHTFSTGAADVGTYIIKNDTTTNVQLHAGGVSYFNGGNVGIGTASPGGLLQVGVPNTSTGSLRAYSSYVIIDAGYQSSNVSGTAATPSLIWSGDDNTGIWHPASDTLAISTAGSERARIDSSGNLLVGKTSAGDSVVGFQVEPSGRVLTASTASTSAENTYIVYSTGASAYRFYVGLNGTINATSTSISAISDQRLKENVKDIDTGLDAIMALKPRRFDWKEGKGQDKKNVAGFIAQEFENVFPECVGKSLAGGDGIEYKNISYETLIPTLVKAIQEQQAIIESLKARLDAANL